VGVDISEGAINFATANYTSPNLRFEVGDILDIGFSDNRFDVITCFETVEHVLNQEECFIDGGMLINNMGAPYFWNGTVS
jgi:2-polyprenyl-3-methyl-5-hydroxy-6-metoxy-1,4-benzoquinol methylase